MSRQTKVFQSVHIGMISQHLFVNDFAMLTRTVVALSDCNEQNISGCLLGPSVVVRMVGSNHIPKGIPVRNIHLECTMTI